MARLTSLTTTRTDKRYVLFACCWIELSGIYLAAMMPMTCYSGVETVYHPGTIIGDLTKFNNPDVYMPGCFRESKLADAVVVAQNIEMAKEAIRKLRNG